MSDKTCETCDDWKLLPQRYCDNKDSPLAGSTVSPSNFCDEHTPQPTAIHEPGEKDKYTISDVTCDMIDEIDIMTYCWQLNEPQLCDDPEECDGHDHPEKHMWMVEGLIDGVDQISNDEGWYFTKRTAQLFVDALNGKLVPASAPTLVRENEKLRDICKIFLDVLEYYQGRWASQWPGNYCPEELKEKVKAVIEEVK